MLVSSLSARDDGAGGGSHDDLVGDTTVVDLVDHFAVIDDPRHPSWVVHPLAAVLVLCSAAVVAGMRGFTAIAGWVTDTPPAMLTRVYTRCGKPAAVPSKSTIWQVATRVDAAAVDAAVGLWLAARADIDIALDTPENTDGDDEQPGPSQPAEPARAVTCSHRQQTDEEDEEAAVGPPRMVLAVDGKRVRGAKDADGNAPHLLAAATHEQGLVLAQTDVHHKTNEIPMFARLLDTITIRGMLITADCLHTQRKHACYLHGRDADFVFSVKDNQCATRRSDTSPLKAGQTRREVCWVRWLTWIRKVKGTRACQETNGRVQMPETVRRETRVVWRKLDCLNPNLQRQHFTATGKASATGVRRGRGVLVRPGQPSRRERCPTRTFKEMSGAPAAALIVCQRRTWDHRPSTADGVGVLIVVAGVTTGRGERESRSQGEGAQVMRTLGNGGGMRNAER